MKPSCCGWLPLSVLKPASKWFIIIKCTCPSKSTSLHPTRYDRQDFKG